MSQNGIKVAFFIKKKAPPPDELKGDLKGIEKKRESNGRRPKSENLWPILPAYLLAAVLPLLNDLVAKMQLLSSGGGDRMDNSPAKRALQILRAGQQNLPERIHQMSREEQLYYAYMVHSLGKSLMEQQGSLQELRSSVELSFFAALLLRMAHSTHEEDGLCDQVLSEDVFSLAVPAFSAMVSERGVMLVQNSTVLEAFEYIDSVLDADTPLGLVLKMSLAKTVLFEHLHKTVTVAGTSQSAHSSQVTRHQNKEPVELKQIRQAVEEAEGRDMSYDTHRILGLSSGLSRVPERYDEETATAQLPKFGSKEEYKTFCILLKEGFSVFLEKSAIKYILLESRDGLKSISQSEIDVVNQVSVDTVSGPEVMSFESSVTQSYRSVPQTYHSTERSTEGLVANGLSMQEDLVKKFQYQSGELKISRYEILSPHVAHDQVLSFDERNVVVDARNVAVDAEVYPRSQLCSEVCSELDETSLEQCEGVCFPPPQSLPTSWCWKRRIESLSVVHYKIIHSSLASLEELDTECQETVCHAVVSVFGDVSLVHALHQRCPNLFGKQDIHGNTPLHNAVLSGDLLMAKQLVGLRPAAVHTQNNDSATPLDVAVDHRNDQMVECLLRESIQHDPQSIQRLQFCVKRHKFAAYLQMFQELRSPDHIEGSLGNSVMDMHDCSTVGSSEDEDIETARAANGSACDRKSHGIEVQATTTTVFVAEGRDPPDTQTPLATADELKKIAPESNKQNSGSEMAPVVQDVSSSSSKEQLPPHSTPSEASANCERKTITPEPVFSDESEPDSSYSTRASGKEAEAEAPGSSVSTTEIETALAETDKIVQCEDHDVEIPQEEHLMIAEESDMASVSDSELVPAYFEPMSLEAVVSHQKLENPSDQIKPVASNMYTQELIAEIVTLKRLNGDLLAQIDRMNEEGTSGSDWQCHSKSQAASSSCTDISSSCVEHPMECCPQCTSAEESNDTTREKAHLTYPQQYTDSVTSSSESSPPQRCSMSERMKKQRKRAKLRHARQRCYASGSDTKEHSKRRPRRPRSTGRKRNLESGSYTDCETSAISNNEQTTTDSAVGDSLQTDTLDEHSPPTLSLQTDTLDEQNEHSPPTLGLPRLQKPRFLKVMSQRKSAAKKHADHWSRSECRYQRYVITVSSFFSLSGLFDGKGFKKWLSSVIHKHGYSQLRYRIHQQLFPFFGFSPLLRAKLTEQQKKIARAVIAVVGRKKGSIPPNVNKNLEKLGELFNAGKCQGEGVGEGVEDSRTGDKKRKSSKGGASPPCKSEAQKPRRNFWNGERSKAEGCHYHSQTEVDGSSCQHDDISELSSRKRSTLSPTCAQEQSNGLSVLEFANPSNPLDVIKSHMSVFNQQCCPRHYIHNTIAVGTTCPPSEAFGPKRRDASIKDIHAEPRHSKFDATKELSAKSHRSRQYVDCDTNQVMFERPSPESVRRSRGAMPSPLVSETTQTRVESESNSSLPLSSQQQSLLQPAAQSKRTKISEEPEGEEWHTPEPPTRHKEPEREELNLPEPPTRHKEPEREELNLPEPPKSHVLPPITDQRSLPIVRDPPSPLDSPSVPDDHKDRLRTTAELLHAQDYTRIPLLAYMGEPPASIPPEHQIPYVFITGLAYYKMSNHKMSVQHFSRCLRLADQCKRDGDVTICNIYIGDIEFAKRKYLDAAGRYQSALHHYSRDTVAKDFRMVLPTKSAVWLKCGSAFKNASRMGDSVAAYEKAIELATAKKDQLSAHTSLGNLYQGIGENGRAVKEYEAAIELAEELKDQVSLGWNHGNLGNALLGLHLRDKALHHLFLALDMAVEHETTPQAIGRAYNNLGTAFQSLNELTKAEEYYDLALAQAIYGNDIPGQARVYGNIGNLQMLNKQYDRAVPHYTEVMRLSQDKATVTTAHHNRGCAYYDWAEKKKNAILQKALPTTARGGASPLPKPAKGSKHSAEPLRREDSDHKQDKLGFRISLHGPDFERCEEIFRPFLVLESIQRYYLQGTRDLEYVIKHHEENFSGIKGSPKGLSLSVSLFETNSRTFHRMQDCLVHIQKGEDMPVRFEDALLIAEQSRARTLGELLLKRRGPQLEYELMSPPSLNQMKGIVCRQSSPVVYLSYTGERLLGWLLFPTPDGQCSINLFEVPLSDDDFDGKSLDYHLRYSLNEQLVEKSFEMYKPFDRKKDKTEPLEKLYDLVARPLMMMLSKLEEKQNQKAEKEKVNHYKNDQERKETQVRKIVIVPDSYTNLLPFTCVLDKDTGKFWGDEFYFQIMPSLLTMGILDQLPTVSVTIPVQYQQMLCVIGNPTIPRFKFNNDEWDLGKLPHATKEAEWVSHILQCNPILHEQATKDAVMMRVMNAKVIHLATHGSAVAGFLAFAGISSSSSEAVDAKRVLIYPEEIETLNISPALVVLSSCDSGRGVFKADGIQGMARAFILAGAQAVLTALWRVPDESACIFMQFFYQYLVEGMRGTEALHKAILCLRCFSKYSQYIHWSGYQLTGREFQFSVDQSSRAELATRLGTSSVFPRLDILKQLETAFLNSPKLPTDVQVLHGPPGVKPSEPLIDFIHCHHTHFSGGIFWINCRTPQLIETSLTSIKKSLKLKELSELSFEDTHPSLVVLDTLDHLPRDGSPLLDLLKNASVHIVVISKSSVSPDSLQKSVHHKLIRGMSIINIQPLSTIHATQRLVHSTLRSHHLAPSRKEQMLFEKLAEFTTGSPPVLDLTSSLLDETLSEANCSTEKALNTFASDVRLAELPQQKPPSFPRETLCSQSEDRFLVTPVRDISRELYDTIKTKEEEDMFRTSAEYDAWQVVTVLIDHCGLSMEEQLLLFCLSSFNCCPIPSSYVTLIATIITKASHQPHLASSLHTKLQRTKMLKVYPKPLVYHPNTSTTEPEIDLVYIPRFISAAIWKDMMSDMDKAMALTTCYKALRSAFTHSPTDDPHLLGLGSILVENCELHFMLVGRACFKEVYSFFLEKSALQINQ